MRINKKLIKKFVFMLSVVSITNIFTLSNINAQISSPNGNVPNDGTGYWKSSNIREWLNSDASTVNYTMPVHSSYNGLKGFLNGFTTDEKNAIAVTKRRVDMTSQYGEVLQGGSEDYSYNNHSSNSIAFTFNEFQNRYKNYYHYMVNDKVFLLTVAEYYLFVENKGFDKFKYPTSKLQEKLGNSNAVAWSLGSAFSNWLGEDNIFTMYDNGHIQRTFPNVSSGIVPAMYIKPTYTFSNGKVASNLSLGDKVTFGTYNGESISWTVINKTSNGYPLILSDNAMEFLPFTAPTTVIPKESRYINFTNVNLDVSSDYNVYYKNNDSTLPKISVTNESDIYSRKENGYNVNIKAEDSSGIKYISTPTGNKVYASTVSFNVSSNGFYTFEVCDNNDNFNRYTVPVNNINLPYQITATPSTTDLTKNNVTVDIKSTAPTGQKVSELTLNNRDTYFNGASGFPNYNTYNNQKIKITGYVECTKDTGGGNPLVGIGVHYTTLDKTATGDFSIGNVWDRVFSIDINTLKANGKTKIEGIYTVSNNYYSSLQPWGNIAVNFGDKNYAVKFTDITYEILDSNLFGIEKIVLPNGATINDKSYTDTLTSKGNYTYKIYDTNGNIHTKTVNALIDKDMPSLNTSYDSSYTNKDLNITVSANDSSSGLKQVTLPNGTISTSKNLTYKVTQNGTYTFKAVDLMGNETTKSVTVNNIDKSIPSITSTVTNASDGLSATIKVKVTDSGTSGIKEFTSYKNTALSKTAETSFTVTLNGQYLFNAVDNAGNSFVKVVTVSGLKDNSFSGIKEIQYKLEGGTVKDWSKYNGTINISNSGTTVVRAKSISLAGNVSAEKSTNVKVDKVQSTINHNIIYNNNNNTAGITLSVVDTMSGVKYITDTKGNIFNTSSINFNITENGTYLVSAMDNAGNLSFKSITVDGLSDSQKISGIKEIQYKLEGSTVKNWTVYNGSFNITNEGLTTVRARAYDNANNVSDEMVLQVRVDKTKPGNNQITIKVIS